VPYLANESDTRPIYTAEQMRMELLHNTVCPFTVYTSAISGIHCSYPRMAAWLRWPRWLVAY